MHIKGFVPGYSRTIRLRTFQGESCTAQPSGPCPDERHNPKIRSSQAEGGLHGVIFG